MKKTILIALLLSILPFARMSAQVEDFGVFKHVGADLNVGTQGIGIDVATPVTNYLELSLGVNFMPGFKISGDVDLNVNTSNVPSTIKIPANIDEASIEGKLSRTTWDFKASVYPFGTKNALFVAAGFSFGGKKIAKLTGHSDALAQNPALIPYVQAEIDKYRLDFDDNGNLNGDIRVNGFRPYIGLGYGRLVPKHRLGFRIELGAQFMGKMKIYQNDEEVDVSTDVEGDDDISKFVDKWKVYPVLKFSLTGRIL